MEPGEGGTLRCRFGLVAFASIFVVFTALGLLRSGGVTTEADVTDVISSLAVSFEPSGLRAASLPSPELAERADVELVDFVVAVPKRGDRRGVVTISSVNGTGVYRYVGRHLNNDWLEGDMCTYEEQRGMHKKQTPKQRNKSAFD